MRLLIFGTGRLSRLAAYTLTRESDHEVCALTVDRRFIEADHVDGLPVVAFEDIVDSHPPDRHALMAPIGWRDMCGLRARVLRQGRQHGYRFASHLSPRALAPAELVLGDNVMVYEGAIIQPFARLGENCIVRAGALISHDVHVGDHGFIAARATLGGGTVLGERCVIGLAATVCSGVRVAPRCFVAAGAVLTVDTEPGGIYRGNPARRSRLSSDKIDRLRL
jgi:sugar O-acyltransferase (sialic acid O-acetyltransferase NeuD family)